MLVPFSWYHFFLSYLKTRHDFKNLHIVSILGLYGLMGYRLKTHTICSFTGAYPRLKEFVVPVLFDMSRKQRKNRGGSPLVKLQFAYII